MDQADASLSDNRDLCAPFLGLLSNTGVCIAVFGSGGTQMRLAASDELSVRLDELQFDLGEGPSLDCMRTGRAVLVPVLDRAAGLTWPIFTSEVLSLAIGAVFALPMRMGAVTVGVVTLSRRSAGTMPIDDLAAATTMATVLAETAARRAIDAVGSTDGATAPGLRREVHQATGMVLVQLETTATIAFARLQAYAFATGSTLDEVARDVLDGRLNFRDAVD